MGANSEVLKARRPVRLPAWVVIGVALALTGALAVVSVSERDTVTRPRSEPAASASEGSAGGSSVAEMAELKAALGQRLWAEQHRIETIHPGLASIQAGPRRRAPVEESSVQGSSNAPQISYTDNGAPVTIDGELCGQCR